MRFKVRWSLVLLCTLLPALSPCSAAVDDSNANCLFAWAERTYPQYFQPPGAASNRYEPDYYYRHYTGAQNYLGISSANDHVYVLGRDFGNVPLDLGDAAGFLATAGCLGSVGIAAQYPGDVGIERDPDVLFVEMGEQPTLDQLLANWSASSAGTSVALDASTTPAGSPGRQSIRLTTTAGSQTHPNARTAMLYRYFPGAAEGTVHARWYVKYNATGTFHHSGARLGGSHPGSATGPYAPAGIRPSGADFFYLGAELSQGKAAPTRRSTVDFYNYWMHQRGTSFFPGTYYGNSFINKPAVAINTEEWNCIEVMLKLNDPVTGFNGEIAMWINGVEVSRVTRGTTGTWDEDNFVAGAGGAAFEGFQWRNDRSLTWNYFQLLHFVDRDPPGMSNSVNYDHVVIARRYIGPMR
jgi:hypothetical protein